VARDHFIPSLDPAAKVPIAYVMGNFNRWFLNKIEEPSGEVSLMWYELQRNSGDQTIVAELGGVKRVETTLASVFALMHQQRLGQPGPLASNGWGNDFYVRDVAGELRSVYIHWCDEGWGVDCAPIVRTTEWPIRDRVFAPVRA
jgi:ABC-type cobalt transport system substrate-binding protein